PGADRLRHLGRGERALERVRGDEHGPGDADGRAHGGQYPSSCGPMGGYELIAAAGTEGRISNPAKVFFREAGIPTLDRVGYYLEVSEPIINQLHDRPTVLKRYVDGAAGKPFFQKRIPDSAP